MDAFLVAVRSGDLGLLVAVLDSAVVIRTDQGPLRELRGTRSVAEKAMLFSHLSQWVQPVFVNVIAGILAWHSDG